jgi:GNAT superfamily N-acetyltransferase
VSIPRIAELSDLGAADASGRCSLRLARMDDIPALETLIEISARTLLSKYYSAQQLDAALGPVFGVDRQLIRDRTYFVVEERDAIIGCGGWSKRPSLFGSDMNSQASKAELNPQTDSARVRAFFIHPDHQRRGIGRAILSACEEAIAAAHFRHIELVATLAGQPFYGAFNYVVVHRFSVPLVNGLGLPVVQMTKTLPSQPAGQNVAIARDE